MSWFPISTFKSTISYIRFLFYLLQAEVGCAFMKFGGDRNGMCRSRLYYTDEGAWKSITVIIIIIIIIGLTRQQTRLYQHAQYWQKNSTYRDMTVCAELHFNMCKEMGVKLDN
jgi:hypothetical protein